MVQKSLLKQTRFFESFRESAKRNKMNAYTKTVLFTELTINESCSKKTGFPIGSRVYYIQRIHYFDDKPLILNHNYFLKACVPDLTKEISEKSIYDYLEHDDRKQQTNHDR